MLTFVICLSLITLFEYTLKNISVLKTLHCAYFFSINPSALPEELHPILIFLNVLSVSHTIAINQSLCMEILRCVERRCDLTGFWKKRPLTSSRTSASLLRMSSCRPWNVGTLQEKERTEKYIQNISEKNPFCCQIEGRGGEQWILLELSHC